MKKMVRISSQKGLLILIGIIIFTFSAKAASYPFKDKKWTIINAENNQEIQKQISVHDDSEVLLLPKSQLALLKDKFSNFTIEFDIKGGSMPGIGFRSNKNLLDFEYFYLRLGNSGKNTAIQYFPVFNGADAWTIYNYPKYESAASFSDSTWIHVKLDVYEDNMRVYVNNEVAPNMEVKLKNTDQVEGNIFLKAGFKNSYFKNVEISELNKSFDVADEHSPYNYINTWRLSEQFEVNFNSQQAIYSKYKEQNKNEQWQTIHADKDGIVNISKYYDHPKNTIIATAEIFSENDKKVDLLFDYSFSLVIGLNRVILFCGTELDTDNFMRVIDGEEKLTLNLKEGRNELVFMIKADDIWQEAVNNPPYLGRKQAANWGFIARLDNYDGIKNEKDTQ